MPSYPASGGDNLFQCLLILNNNNSPSLIGNFNKKKSLVGFISKYCVFVPVLYRLQYWGTLHQPPLVKHQGIKLNHNSDKAGTQQHRDFEQDLLRQWKQAFRFASVTKHLIFHIFQLPFSRYLVIYKFHRFSHLFSRLYLKFVSWAQDRSHSLETFRLTTGRCKHSCSVCSVETA